MATPSLPADYGTDKERDELIFGLIQKRLEEENSRASDLDGKANNMIGFVSVAISLLLGAGAVSILPTLSNVLNGILFFIGIGGLMTSIFLALFGFRIRKWIAAPDVGTLREKYTTQSYKETLQRNAGSIANAVTAAVKNNEVKARLVNWSWYFLIVGLVSILIFIIIQTATPASPQSILSE